MNQEKIGKFILELRKEKGMTQQDLALQLGVTDRAIGNWENGRRLPDYTIVKNLCDALDITVNEFLVGEKIKKAEYQNVAEQNLIALKKQIDKKRKMTNILMFISSFIVCAMFVGNMVLNYIYKDNWNHDFYSEIAWTFVIITWILWFISSLLNYDREK